MKLRPKDNSMMLGDVLDSPLMLTKLQAGQAAPILQSHSAGFHYHHQASAHEHVHPRSRPSVNDDMALPYGAVTLFAQQAPYHPIMGYNVLAFSSSESPPSLAGPVENTALISHHLPDNANSATSSYMQSFEHEKHEEKEDEAAILVSSNFPTCIPLFGARNHNIHHDAQNSPYHCHYASGLSSSHEISVKHMQYDPSHSFVSEKFSFPRDHQLQAEDCSSLIASDVQLDSNTASSWNGMMNGGGCNPDFVATMVTSSSSSSATPSSMYSAGGQLIPLPNETLQAAWKGYLGAGPFNEKLIGTNSGMVDAEMHIKIGGTGTHQASAVNSTLDHQKSSNKKRSRKRKRRCYKNVEEMETQRKTHIAVERNRRKQMNEHLRALRLLMPQSYIERGDQASIVGATIRFVEEMQQVLQCLKLQKQVRTHCIESYGSYVGETYEVDSSTMEDAYASMPSSFLNVEVTTLTSTTFFMKIKAQKMSHQLLHTLLTLSKLSLRTTHLNVTSFGPLIIYSFNLELDNNDFQILTPFELAELIKHMLCMQSMLKPIEC
ncbi:hypothetical protein GOP47_0002563 [Adiantum capillus-veneris]|uniref:BHLH domain-containing protein n=1 Tax=Adiantum capillus-veneris TaxID=13818 RepID=A0A9D4VB63_ADICA|nr:hypothetical protein GOP47_0002563 [Adiantum capillus-veneris]